MLTCITDTILKASSCFLVLLFFGACAVVESPETQKMPRQSQNFDRNVDEIGNQQLKIRNLGLAQLKSQIAKACLASGLMVAFEVEDSQSPSIVGCQTSTESRAAMMFELMPDDNGVSVSVWWPKALTLQSRSVVRILGAQNG